MCTVKAKLPFMYIILLPWLHNFISNSMRLQFSYVLNITMVI